MNSSVMVNALNHAQQDHPQLPRKHALAVVMAIIGMETTVLNYVQSAKLLILITINVNVQQVQTGLEQYVLTVLLAEYSMQHPNYANAQQEQDGMDILVWNLILAQVAENGMSSVLGANAQQEQDGMEHSVSEEKYVQVAHTWMM